MTKCKKYQILFFLVAFAVITVAMINRARYGINIVDEAYYMADGKTVLEGNVPYALNNCSVTGMTFLMIPFVWIYRLFSPEYTGYFLYMRIMFILFRGIILLICFLLLQKMYGSFCSACTVLPVLAYHNAAIQNFSYNNNSFILIFLVGVLLIYLQDRAEPGKTKASEYFLAGILSALAVFSHPAHAISVILFCLLLLLFRTPFREILAYIAGGIAQIVIVFAFIIAQAGWKTTYQGMRSYGHSVSGMEASPLIKTVNLILAEYKALWRVMLVIFFVLLLSALFTMGIASAKQKKHLVTTAMLKRLVLGATQMSALVGLFFILFRYQVSSQKIVHYVGACAFLTGIFLAPFFWKEKAIWFIGMPGMAFCLLEAFMTTSNPPDYRFIYAMPMLAALFLVDANLNNNREDRTDYKENRSKKRFIENPSIFHKVFAGLTIAVSSMCILCEMKGLQYVYVDSPLPELRYKIDQGVFKGIYTTERNAKDTIELEYYIRNNTDKDELIAFRDNVPVGYLFMNGKICDIRTWDCMSYYAGNKNPSNLYAYYERFGNTPDKIIYVDFGMTEKLSIYDDSFQYNEFLNGHYTMLSNIKLNETYKKVIIYIKDSHDTL